MVELFTHSTTDRRRSPLARYLVAALLASIADEGVRVCLVLLAVGTTGSPAIGGAMIAVLLVPHVVAAPVVGALIDRAARPRATIAMLIGGFATTLFAVAALIGRVSLWVVFALLLAGGCCGPAITAGLSGQLPGLVDAGSVPRAPPGPMQLLLAAGSPLLAGVAAVGVLSARTKAAARFER